MRFCLPIGQCRGQAYDGASNMLGHINGVAACIQKDEPSAIYVHCLAHCTNLCLQTVGRQVAPVRDALELVREVSQLIRFSPKRSTLSQCSLSFHTVLLVSNPFVLLAGLFIQELSILFLPTIRFFVMLYAKYMKKVGMIML